MLHGLEGAVNDNGYEFDRKRTFQTLLGKTWGNLAVKDTFKNNRGLLYTVII